MHVLGISGLYHDSAACLVTDGQLVAAAQEERFTRRKHDPGFPESAIRYCLEEAGIGPDQLDHVVFYEKPLLHLDRLLETYLRYAPRGVVSFIRAVGRFINEKARIPRTIDASLNDEYTGPLHFVRHHEAHAASAFFPSPFDRAAIVTIDGVGEWTTTSIGLGEGNRIGLQKEIRFPHSLGLLYSAFTYYTGFRVNSGEYKLMGLAPYGQPIYRDRILDELVDLRDDGSFHLDMRYFDYTHRMTMINDRFCRLFGGPARPPEAEIERRHADLAASIQAVTEEVMLRLAAEAKRLTGANDLCLAGGVALNCVGNGRILREGPFERIWIQPAAGDAGGALGSALYAWYQLLDNPREAGPDDAQHGSYLGPGFSTDTIAAELDAAGVPYHRIADEAELLEKTVTLLEEQNVVGWFQGRMEFGPRALGARTILADPREPAMQSRVNLKIKFREGFRPFAPVVMRERASDFFELDTDSPYMLLVAPVAEQQRIPVEDDDPAADLLARLHRRRSGIAAVTHVDYSARVQTCDATRNPRLHRLLARWNERTDCAVLLNTSFNVRGEPIVCTPHDAYACFMRTEMDALVMEDLLLLKGEQPAYEGPKGAMALD